MSVFGDGGGNADSGIPDPDTESAASTIDDNPSRGA